ncbi:hypothetical protein V8F20_004779, partial [Naviculisporaceae sp. PSN 640]
ALPNFSSRSQRVVTSQFPSSLVLFSNFLFFLINANMTFEYVMTAAGHHVATDREKLAFNRFRRTHHQLSNQRMWAKKGTVPNARGIVFAQVKEVFTPWPGKANFPETAMTRALADLAPPVFIFLALANWEMGKKRARRPQVLYGSLFNAQSSADEMCWAVDAALHFLARNPLPGGWLGHPMIVLGVFDFEPKARNAEAVGRFREAFRALARAPFAASRAPEASTNVPAAVEKRESTKDDGSGAEDKLIKSEASYYLTS